MHIERTHALGTLESVWWGLFRIMNLKLLYCAGIVHQLNQIIVNNICSGSFHFQFKQLTCQQEEWKFIAITNTNHVKIKM